MRRGAARVGVVPACGPAWYRRAAQTPPPADQGAAGGLRKGCRESGSAARLSGWSCWLCALLLCYRVAFSTHLLTRFLVYALIILWFYSL